jgi:sulfide:quinone oxidoreductase
MTPAPARVIICDMPAELTDRGEPAPLEVVIAGGGVAAFETALALHDLAGPRAAITVVAPGPELVEEAMSVAEPFALGHAGHHPVADLVAHVGGRLVADRLHHVDMARRVVILGEGAELAYDVLVVAVGARRRVRERHALTFLGSESTEGIAELREDLHAGGLKRLALVVPEGMTWPLPLYELAVLLGSGVRADGVRDARLWLLTPELDPLEAFGRRSSQAVATLLARSGVTFVGSVTAQISAGAVHFGAGRRLDVGRIVTLPVLTGPRVPGVPCDGDGFIPVDEYGRVRDVFDVYAVGDGAAFPIKQGGLAAQQADAAASAIAAEAGAPVDPKPFRPVLRGTLLTEEASLSMRHALARGSGAGVAAERALWTPGGKVAGRYLAPYLREHGEAAGDQEEGGGPELESLGPRPRRSDRPPPGAAD